MTTIRRTVAMVLASTMLGGCGGGSAGSESTGTVDQPEAVTAALTSMADCDALHESFRADARQKIQTQATELRAHWAIFTSPDDGSGSGNGPEVSCTPTPIPIPTPGAPGPSHDATDTNTQVPGVDEPDVIETDGDRLYILRDSELLVLTAYPPAATAVSERIAIAGAPLGMFVSGGRALVASQVFDAAGDLGGDPRCASIGAPLPQSTSGFAPSCQPSFVKLTLLDLTHNPAKTVRELYVEGDYVTARRHDGTVRVIVRRNWGVPAGVRDPWTVLSSRYANETEVIADVDAWERSALAAIDASTLTDWLPAERERVGGTLVEHALTCEHAHVPSVGEAGQGMTLVVALDLTRDDGPVDDTLLVGDASQVYANGDTLVLAAPEWQVAPMGNATSRTALHVFALPAASLATVYRGSGFVPGIPLSQFAMDAQGDILRVATNFFSSDRLSWVTRVTTTRIDGGALVTIGASEDLAPGEQFVGARFVDDRAYLVTYEAIDPLFVVDLSDPAQPTVLGEVQLPGFSEYLHPLDPGHLLTIGRADSRGPAVRIFDVSDPTAPRLTYEYAPDPDSWTLVEADHHAFTFDASRGLLALPLERFQSGDVLQVVAVDVHTGFALRGEIEHPPSSVICAPPFDWESCIVSTTMLRGLFIDDFVYSISTDRVEVHALDDLDEPVAEEWLR